MINKVFTTMSTAPNPEVHPLISGPPNLRVVREYLKINDSPEVARLAASMAPRPKTFDPIALVDAAIALQAEAEAGLIRRREEMVAKMIFQTLLELAKELDIYDMVFANRDDEKFSDPIAGPVLRLLQHIMERDNVHCSERSAALKKKALECADSRTELPRPILHCDLEAALRYALDTPNDSDYPWPLLEKSFIDFLGIYEIKLMMKQESDYRSDIREQYDRDTKTQADLKRNAKTDPHAESQYRSLEEELKTTGELIEGWKKEEFYTDFFTPSQSTPPRIKQLSESIYDKYWKDSGSVKSEALLVFIVSEFHAFWEKHAIAYKKHYDDNEKQRKRISKKNAMAGAKGPKARDHEKWILRTTDFIEYRNKVENRNTPWDINSLVKTFAENHSGLKDQDAIARVETFFGTLCNLEGREGSESDALGILQKNGIKAISQITIEECLGLLSTVKKRGVKKL